MLKGMGQTPPSSHLRIPPDEPAGKLNLKWPATVPYVQTGPNGMIVPVKTSTTLLSKDIEPGSQTTTSISPAYGETLAVDQFRLACLSAVDTESTALLIHLNLEVYQDHNCPDYEATSYTWGGEDDDSSL
ncbi:hypothetical protein EG329_013249 [Mollisiaceae sp. DMI_Dod_QoI]|nr:hypothetical protein EG329_013249 [Helotiales sp. DMI_Dod_QoI]